MSDTMAMSFFEMNEDANATMIQAPVIINPNKTISENSTLLQ